MINKVRCQRSRFDEYTAVRQRAREKTLTPAEPASPLAAVPYSLRHTIVSKSWPAAGPYVLVSAGMQANRGETGRTQKGCPAEAGHPF